MNLNLTATVLILGLATAWILQYIFAFWQMRRYYRRLGELRQKGTVWVGLAGSAWRRRQYAVLVVDRRDRIVCVEQLSGWTVMADLKPVPGLEGHAVSEITDNNLQLNLPPKLLLALQDAVKHKEEHAKRMAEKDQTDDDSSDNQAPTADSSLADSSLLS